MEHQAFVKRSVTTELAREMLAAAEARAADVGLPFSIAIVDESGTLKAFSRMDHAPVMTVQVAQDKAYTAAGFGMPTDTWHEFISEDAQLAAGAAEGIDRLIVFAGGLPITVDSEVVGGVGVSGGHWSQDKDIAESALAVIR